MRLPLSPSLAGPPTEGALSISQVAGALPLSRSGLDLRIPYEL